MNKTKKIRTGVLLTSSIFLTGCGGDGGLFGGETIKEKNSIIEQNSSNFSTAKSVNEEKDDGGLFGGLGSIFSFGEEEDNSDLIGNFRGSDDEKRKLIKEKEIDNNLDLEKKERFRAIEQNLSNEKRFILSAKLTRLSDVEEDYLSDLNDINKEIDKKESIRFTEIENQFNIKKQIILSELSENEFDINSQRDSEMKMAKDKFNLSIIEKVNSVEKKLIKKNVLNEMGSFWDIQKNRDEMEENHLFQLSELQSEIKTKKNRDIVNLEKSIELMKSSNEGLLEIRKTELEESRVADAADRAIRDKKRNKQVLVDLERKLVSDRMSYYNDQLKTVGKEGDGVVERFKISFKNKMNKFDLKHEVATMEFAEELSMERQRERAKISKILSPRLDQNKAKISKNHNSRMVKLDSKKQLLLNQLAEELSLAKDIERDNIESIFSNEKRRLLNKKTSKIQKVQDKEQYELNSILNRENSSKKLVIDEINNNKSRLKQKIEEQIKQENKKMEIDNLKGKNSWF